MAEKCYLCSAKTRKEHSSVGLERFSHIEEVIGSSPIVPTERPSKDAWLFCFNKQKLATMSSETYLQLRAFARLDGFRLGLFWVVSFALFIGYFTYPICGILWFGTILFTPFYVGMCTNSYSEQTEGHHISYGQAYAHSALTVFYASLILAIAQWAYFQYLDNGFLINQYAMVLTNQENKTMMEGMGYTSDMIDEILESLRSLRPIDLTLQMMWSNMVAGLIISITTALYVSFRH